MVDAQALIVLQSSIRENMRQLNEEFRSLEATFRNESSKRRRVYPQAEADSKRQIIANLAEEIESVKTQQKQQYTKGYRRMNLNLPSMQHAELFSSPNVDDSLDSSVSSFLDDGGNVTAAQKERLLKFEERDRKFELEVLGIGNGVDDLLDLAVKQNEEVKKQNVMLEDMATRMEGASTKLENVNLKMKRALSRSGDKLCVDIFCIVLAMGLFSGEAARGSEG